MYKLGFCREPVINCMAMSLSPLFVKFVSTLADCVFEHRLWGVDRQFDRNGIHSVASNRWCDTNSSHPKSRECQPGTQLEDPLSMVSFREFGIGWNAIPGA